MSHLSKLKSPDEAGKSLYFKHSKCQIRIPCPVKEFSRNEGEVQSQLRCLISSQEGLPTGNAKAEFFIFLNFFLDKLKCAKSKSLSSGRKKK